jgi:hypothetical protein
MRTFRTVLEQKIWERRQTLEEFAEFAELFAREHSEPGTLGSRHLQRLASGHGPKGRPLGPVKVPVPELLAWTHRSTGWTTALAGSRTQVDGVSCSTSARPILAMFLTGTSGDRLLVELISRARLADARLGATLRREMEEELFGRADVDGTAGESRIAAPMHLSRLSKPMRWLSEDPARMRLECTGFGVNMVSGNYEFASLIMIEDDEFWPLFGGDVEANWESAGLRLYSSLDRESISDLIIDESWSNEGLFAFLQGLRRLAIVGGTRVDLPTVELGRS